jgi:hypothetical protein
MNERLRRALSENGALIPTRRAKTFSGRYANSARLAFSVRSA